MHIFSCGGGQMKAGDHHAASGRQTAGDRHVAISLLKILEIVSLANVRLHNGLPIFAANPLE